MICNFQQPALILRIYGRGMPVLPADNDWNALAAHFTLMPGTRQIFDISVESVQTSCGYGVPLMELQSERATLVKYHDMADPEVWLAKRQKNEASIDGLPVRATDRYIAGDAKTPSD